MKLNPRTCTSGTRGTSGAKARLSRDALIAALKRCAGQRHFFITAPIRCLITVCLSFVFAFLLIGSAAFAQDADKTAVPAPAAKKNAKKDQKQAEKTETPKEEKKGDEC